MAQKQFSSVTTAATINQSQQNSLVQWYNAVPESSNMSKTYSWHVFQQVRKDDGCCRCIGLLAAANYADSHDCQYIQWLAYSTHHSKTSVLRQRTIQCLSGKECTLSVYNRTSIKPWKQWMHILLSMISTLQANWVGHLPCDFPSLYSKYVHQSKTFIFPSSYDVFFSHRLCLVLRASIVV